MSEKRKSENPLSRLFRTGLEAALLTEKEARAFLARIFAREVSRFLNHINIHKELEKALEEMTIEIRFKRKKKARP